MIDSLALWYQLKPSFRGDVAEWLGSALQKLLQRFESARHLHFFIFYNPEVTLRDFFYPKLNVRSEAVLGLIILFSTRAQERPFSK